MLGGGIASQVEHLEGVVAVRDRFVYPARPAGSRLGSRQRAGEVLAVVGASKGSTVRTWIDPSGAVTDPPMDHRVIVGNIWLTVMMTCLVSWVLLLAAGMLARRALDRRRLRAGEAEWRASGPQWSGHRS